MVVFSKAGKVRKQTPQVAPSFPNRKNKTPIQRNRRNYKLRETYVEERRFEDRKKIGQRHHW